MTWQNALWALPTVCGRWWDVAFGFMAALAAIIMFIKLIMHHDFSLLLLSRILIGLGFLGFALIPLNSGWTKIGIALTVMGGLLSSILLATGWCERKDQSLTVPQALWRWITRSEGRSAQRGIHQ